jgi:hypothetical protein
MSSPDPWTGFLEWLTTVMVPNWEELIAMLPFFLILGVIGPLLTLIVLMWAWHFVTRRKGRVRIAEPQAVPAPRGASGDPLFPVNVPYCPTHALVYPPSQRRCAIDGEDLQVSCPVDGTSRSASIQECGGCGTRFVLGATVSPVLVQPVRRPPSGGAAAA